MSVVGIHLIHLGSELLIGLRRDPGLSFLYVIYGRIYSLAPQQLSFLYTACMNSRKGVGENGIELQVPPLSDGGSHWHDTGGCQLS